MVLLAEEQIEPIIHALWSSKGPLLQGPESEEQIVQVVAIAVVSI